ncbi:cupin domain-containing protein [Micromonospora sp. CA-240977]|uniref:cupin domain-containing protein n=1 Tax=Micromonospora sp. CA-240977 TaxID=3239957 RepID=UPI003D8C7C86
MSLEEITPEGRASLYVKRGVIHRPAGTGITKWVSGDIYTVKATGADSNGSLGFIEAIVPPGGGPVAHVHFDREEAFYLLDGELEFLDGNETVMAGAGDFLLVPRGTRHRFKNIGSKPAKMVFMFASAGDERLLVELGDDPVEGQMPAPWPPERFEQAGPIAERLGLNTENLP